MLTIIGVLLAGGQSRRFGTHKAFAQLNGMFFWESSMNAMKRLTDQQVIISHPELVKVFQQYESYFVCTDDDNVVGKGPLAGMYTTMNHIMGEWYIFLSCDIPFISELVIKQLLRARNNKYLAIIPQVDGKIHPLIGVYHRSSFEYITSQLQNNELKLSALLQKMPVKYMSIEDMGVERKVFCNINSQEDYITLQSNDKI
ncbi:molybdenum cofactor guanylyltransferase [Metabacillus malikii]|nr:molybdenum cofactor guanylyltransferase [Metabacillus malikii]